MEIGYVLGIYGCVLLAILWSIFNMIVIRRIKIEPEKSEKYYNEGMDSEQQELSNKAKFEMVVSIGQKIKKGAYAFLFQEYTIMLIFVILFLILVICLVDVWGIKKLGVGFRAYAGMAFVIGSMTSILCGFIGMDIAVRSNYKTTFCATYQFLFARPLSLHVLAKC